MEIPKIEGILENLSPYFFAFLKAGLLLIVGLYIIKKIVSGVKKLFSNRNVDPSLQPFLISLISVILKVVLVITAIGILGVETTTFAAVLAAGGLAVGLALSGTLQNFAGGVMILIFKPFKKGDFIEAQGFTGTVNEIQIFHTILKTPDNKTVILPNGELSNASMTNFTTEEKRRVDWEFGIAYGDDADKAKAVFQRLADEDERILKDPEVFVALSELADSSVNFKVRAWVLATNYWPVFFAMNEQVYKVFAQEGLSIPFPQMDVHLHNEKK